MIEIIKTCISLTIELTFLSAIKKREIRVATKTLKFCKYSPTESTIPKQS
jgi:hypothetical protein